MNLAGGRAMLIRCWSVSPWRSASSNCTQFVPNLGHSAKGRLALEPAAKPSPAAVRVAAGGVPPGPLDLTEENIKLVIGEAKNELGQIFDGSVGITGQVELVELDGPFVTISLKGRFWHKRSTVLARIGNYLKQRIPEILEVEIEDEQQLDDSPANF